MSIKLTKAQTKSLASGVRRPKYKPRESRTVKNFFNNHEMWKICPKCGEETDLRKSKDCENCGEKLIYDLENYEINISKVTLRL